MNMEITPMIDLAGKGFLWLALCTLGLRLLPRSSAATRHALRSLSFAGLLALPLLARTLPPLPWIPAFGARHATAVIAAGAPVIGPAGTAATALVTRTSPAELFAAVWAAGAALLLLSLAVALVRARGLVKRSRPATGAWIEDAARFTRERGGRIVRVLTSDEVATPVTTGLLNPAILLPPAASAWSSERRSAVLLHELAHVRRFDCGAQWVAQVACAIHWFNPLAWLSARELRLEREQAADDDVLAQGTLPSDYASMLMELVQSIRKPVLWFDPSVSMAAWNQLEGRVRGILEGNRPRGTASFRTVAIAAALGLAVLVPTASLGVEDEATPPSGRAAKADREFRVAVGQTATLGLRDVARVAVAAPNVVDVKVLGEGRIQLEGREPGVTELRVWTKDGSAHGYHVSVSGKSAGTEAPATTATAAPVETSRTPSSTEMTLAVTAGSKGLVTLPKMKRVAVGDPSVADVRMPGETSLEIIGRAAGVTTVMAWGEDGTTTVVHITVIDPKKAGASKGEGTLARDVIAKTIHEHMPDVNACYQAELAKNPKAAGRIVVAFTVDVTGAVQHPTVETVDVTGAAQDPKAESADVGFTTLGPCVVERTRSWKFPAPSGGPVTVKYPFVFTN